MHENENFAPSMIFSPRMFMGSWAVHNFMHVIFTHEIRNTKKKYKSFIFIF